MADFTSREADEADTLDRQREKYRRLLGHEFPGGLACVHCEVSLRELVRREEAQGLPAVPVCPNRGRSGNKYHRVIHELAEHRPAGKIESWVTVDVYSVLTAFAVTSPGLQHAAKKILCAGIRGKGSRVQDLREARDALDRAIEDAEREVGDAAG